MIIRNWCFDKGILKSTTYGIPVISVGNITVGGTGKTPLSEYIIRLLIGNYQLALLSRGYKRKTKGTLLANKSSSAETIGDEPFQIKQKFEKLRVAVAEKRVEGMDLLLRNTNTQVVLMDDAYQHRYVTPGLSILVIDYNRPLWKDCVFPAGNLRETKNGQKRADIIIVNKCPASMRLEDRDKWLSKLKARGDQEVYFTTVKYDEPVAVKHEANKLFPAKLPVVALAGIAQPKGFFEHVAKKCELVKTMTYPDHHHFSDGDLMEIEHQLSQNKVKALITTEKDAVRFAKMPEEIKTMSWYIPIKLIVLFDEEERLENTILNYVRENQNNG